MVAMALVYLGVSVKPDCLISRFDRSIKGAWS